MTPATHAHPPATLLGSLLQVLRTATLQRLALPDVDGTEIEERVLLESHLVRTPAALFAAQKAPLL